MSDVTLINREFDCLHPELRHVFVGLSERLLIAYHSGETKTRFEFFEGYRSPERQDYLFSITKTTKARPWQSAHQYGLAADFVPRHNGRWSWDGHHDYEFLKKAAREFGMDVPIAWDLCHVEHRAMFRDMKLAWA